VSLSSSASQALTADNRAVPPARGRLQWADLANTAGAITIGRLGIAVAFPLIVHSPRWALIAYTVAIVSDVVDGNVARWTGTQSHTGGVVDGWVDKVLHINAAWAMALHDYMPAWWLWLWFSRELVQGAMVFWLVGDFHSGRVRVQQTSLWGRITAVSLAAVFIATLTNMHALSFPLTCFTGVAGIAAAVGYFRRALDDRSRFR